MLESPLIPGWKGFTDWSVQAQIVVKTKPSMQWSVARALRKASLELLHKEGLHVAIPLQRFEKSSWIILAQASILAVIIAKRLNQRDGFFFTHLVRLRFS